MCETEARPRLRWMGAGLCLGLALLVSGCLGQGQKPSTDPRGGDPDDLSWVRLQAELFPQEPYWPYRAAELYVEEEAMEEAEAMLRQSLEIDPVYPPALSLLSWIYYEAGRHEEAVERLEEVLTLTPDPDALPRELLEGLALHYEALGDPVTGGDLLASRIDTASPTSPVRTFLLLRGENFRAAAEPARKALEEDEETAVNCNNYGITRLQAGDPFEAKACFLRAHEIDPELPGPLYNLAIVEEFYLLNHDEAVSWFERYRELSQDDPDNLGEVLGGGAPPDVDPGDPSPQRDMDGDGVKP